MIFAKQHFNLQPASPATRDRFVATTTDAFIPAAESHGARLLGAWFCNEEWFSQIVHVTAFENLAAYDTYNEAAHADSALAKAGSDLTALAPENRTELLETLGPISEAAIEAGITASANKPAEVYTFAILEVAAGRMDAFKALLGGAGDALPILAAWRDLAGNPNRVIDLWRGDVGRTGYAPSSEGLEAFFGPLREVAPREHLVRLHALPYSPLR